MDIKRITLQCGREEDNSPIISGEEQQSSLELQPKDASAPTKPIFPKSSNKKDCNAWKSKGRCKKIEMGKFCPYQHDESVRTIAIEKKRQKMIEHQKNHHHHKRKSNKNGTTKMEQPQQQQKHQQQTKRHKEERNEKETNHQHPLGIRFADGQGEPKIVYSNVNGVGDNDNTIKIRHIEPYWIIVSLPLQKYVGMTIHEALTTIANNQKQKKRCTKRPPIQFWFQQLDQGSLSLLENNNNHDGYEISGFSPDRVIEKTNALKGKFHFHEESILWNIGNNNDSTQDSSLIVYEDKEYLIVNKPPGMDVLTNTDAGRVFNSLPGILYTNYDIRYRCYAAHRIDNSVSGIVCFGKTIKAQKRLTRRIKFGEAQKTYLARVRISSALSLSSPFLPTASAASSSSSSSSYSSSMDALLLNLPSVIDVPLGFDARSCLAVVADSDIKNETDNENNNNTGNDGYGTKACTTTIVRCLDDDDDDGCHRNDGTKVLEVQPKTGRKHQIRKHLEHVGLPIANDQRYGGTVRDRDNISAFWGISASSGNRSAMAVGSSLSSSSSSFEELLSAAYTDGCAFCLNTKKLYESGRKSETRVGNNGVEIDDGGFIFGPVVSRGIWLHSLVSFLSRLYILLYRLECN